MSLWTARTNGTQAHATSHVIPTPSGASTPAGAFLMVVVSGASVNTTSTSGWTRQLHFLTTGSVDVFVKPSASAGEASLTVATTDRNVQYESFEFPAGTSYVAGSGVNSATATAAWTALAGLATATFFYAAVATTTTVSTTATGTTTWTGTGLVKSLDSVLQYDTGNNTSGTYLSTVYAETLWVTSWTPASSSATTNTGTAFSRGLLGLSVPLPPIPVTATGSGDGAGVASFTATGSGDGTGTATTVPAFTVPGIGASTGVGIAGMVPAVAITASGAGVGSGSAQALNPAATVVTASGTGNGSGSAQAVDPLSHVVDLAALRFTVTGPFGSVFNIAGPTECALSGGLFPDNGVYPDDGARMENYTVTVGVHFTVAGPYSDNA